MHEFVGATFRPMTPDPVTLDVRATSREWYGGKRDHLPVARIVPAAQS
jgi:hypothetical protein